MQLKDIAVKNLWRRKSKMLFLVFGMVFGIATIVALFTLTNAMEKSITHRINELGLKLAIVPENDTASFSVGGIPVVSGISYKNEALPPETLITIDSISKEDVKIVSPKVMGKTTINNEDILTVGVDFPSEFRIKSWWELALGRRPGKINEALIGVRASEKLNVTLGNSFKVNNQTFIVSGVLAETGEEEDGIVFINLNAAQKALGKENQYSFIELVTERNENTADRITQAITSKVPGVNVKLIKEAAEARQELVGKFGRFSLVVSIVMVVIAALIITTTMMGSVNERTREIGVFRAIGYRKAHVTKIILTEAGLICGISGIIGYLVGIGTALLIKPLFSSFELQISWDLLFGLIVITGSILLGLLATLYPASKAAKLDPAEAMRYM